MHRRFSAQERRNYAGMVAATGVQLTN